MSVTLITDPESVSRDKGHDLQIHGHTWAHAHTHTHTHTLCLAMWSIFTGACHCVWGRETKVNDGVKGKTSLPCVQFVPILTEEGNRKHTTES